MESWWDNDGWNNVRTLGEFAFMLLHPITDNPADMFKQRLKGDLETAKEIMAYNNAWLNPNSNNKLFLRIVAHNMWKLSPNSLKSVILPNNIKPYVYDFVNGKYPREIKELDVNGNDLMQLGLKGQQIGDALSVLLKKVYNDEVENKKESLIKSIS